MRREPGSAARCTSADSRIGRSRDLGGQHDAPPHPPAHCVGPAPPSARLGTGAGVATAGGGCHGANTIEAWPTEEASTVVKIDGCTFAPTVTRVPTGTEVRFLNIVERRCTTSWVGPARGAPIGSTVARRSLTASATPGVYPYSCSLHPGMAGVVVVGSPALPPRAAAADRLTIAPVAATAPAADIGRRLADPVRWPPEGSASWRAALGARGRAVARRRPARLTLATAPRAPLGRLLDSPTNIQSAYFLCARGASLASSRPVPDLVTEIPGPKARAHVAFDETWTSPSLPRAYPIVPGSRRRPDDRGHRRQPLPRFRRRHRGQLDRSFAPAGRRRDQGAGGRADPLLGVRLLPADLPGGLQAPRRDHAGRRRQGAGLPRQQRAPKSSRPRSSWPATRRSGRTWSRSSARSTAARTARCR